jgi:hypothetical protein
MEKSSSELVQDSYDNCTVTQEEINMLPKKDFKYAHWLQSNKYRPIYVCEYVGKNRYRIGGMGIQNASIVIKYLKINVMRIVPDNYEEISYKEFDSLKTIFDLIK